MNVETCIFHARLNKFISRRGVYVKQYALSDNEEWERFDGTMDEVLAFWVISTIDDVKTYKFHGNWEVQSQCWESFFVNDLTLNEAYEVARKFMMEFEE
jgi:hypothetical protein